MKGYRFYEDRGKIRLVDLDDMETVISWPLPEGESGDKTREVLLSFQDRLNAKLREALDASRETPASAPPFDVRPPAPVPNLLGLEPELEDLIAVMRRKGYAVFENDSASHNLNLVGIRNMGAKLDAFSCRLVAFWKHRGQWHERRFVITTLPGSRYLIEKLLSSKGCAILAPGQYRNVYALDLHGGRYEALCQRKGPVKVYRDGDRDREFDMVPDSIEGGWFGINIHAPIDPRDGLRTYVQEAVRASSAGCQVFRAMADFLEFRDLCRASRANFGNAFTYTLLESSDVSPA